MTADDAPTIIVAADSESHDRDALEFGATLARWRGARILIVGVFVAPFGVGDRGYEAKLREALTQSLESLRKQAPPGVPVETRIVDATSVVRGLHAVAEEVAADALVLGHSHSGRAARALHRDVTFGLIQAAPTAVGVAPAGYAASATANATPIIGVAYDTSPEADHALSTGAELARASGGSLHIISVVDFPFVYVDPPIVDEEGRKSYVQSVKTELTERLDAARARVADNLAVSTEVVDGGPAAELARADRGLDLLVMGSRGYGPVRRVLLGSTVAGVIADASFPVLIVPRGAPA